MGIHAILWDMGGVIVRTEDHQPRNALLTRHNMDPVELDRLFWGHPGDFKAQLGEISYQEHIDNIRNQLGFSPEEMENFQTQFFAGDIVDHDLVDFIRELKKDYCVAMLSNMFDNLRSLVRDEWQIDDAFHGIIVSAEVGMMKPHPEIFLLALEKIGFSAHETVFIDDSMANIKGAQDVGLHAIHFKNPEQAKTDLLKLIN